MKANELRVGNYIKAHESLLNPKGEFLLTDILLSEFIRHGLTDKLLPIHLTEEWLPKLRLNEESKYILGLDWKFENNKLILFYEDVQENECIVLKIKFVHEYQNFYFALKHKELKIK